MAKHKQHFSKTGTIDYQTLIKKTSVQDRVNMLNSQYGQSLLSSFTAEQYASLFPKYYLEKLPQIEGFMKALTPEGRGMVASGSQISGGTYSKPGGTMAAPTATSAGRPNVKPAWVSKIEQETGVTVSDPGAKVQLSQEKQDIVNLLKAGEIPADDPRIVFLKDLSPADLQKAGLQKNDKGDGKYTYSKPEIQVSDEEVDKKIRESSSKAGLNKDTKLVEHEPSHTTTALGVDKRQYNSFRESLAGIESRGGQYGIVGGSSGRFSGAYQFGADEIRETARQLGEREPSREEFLKDPALQERFLDRYTKSHHDQLMGNPKYAAMSPEERLGVLAYAHNQGAGGASKWLTTGQAGSDAFGTSGTKYTSAVAAQLAKTKDQKVETDEPITPEQRKATREKIIKEREVQQETALATSTIPKLPEGLDPKVAQYYERLNPGQKQRFHEALGKMGTDQQTAVARLNETYQKNPESLGMAAMRPSGNIDIPKTQSDAHKVVAETAKGTVRYQASVIDKAVELLGAHERGDKEQIKAYLKKAGPTGGLDPEGRQGAWCAAFVNSSLAQSGIAHTGSNMARSYLNWGEQKRAEEMAAGDVLAHTDGSHVGLSTGKTRQRSDGSLEVEMLGGNQGDKVTKKWVRADQISVRRASENQYHPEVLAAIKRGETEGSAIAAVQDQTGVKVGDKGQQTEAAKAKGVGSTQVPGAPGYIKPPEAAPQQAPSAPQQQAPVDTSSETAETKQSVSGTMRMGAPDGPIKFNDKTINPTDPGYEEAGRALIQKQKEMQQISSELKPEQVAPDNTDPYLRKVKSPLADAPASTITPDVIQRANDSAKQASKIAGPKKLNPETGQWEPYQLAEQPKYDPPKILEPTMQPEGEPTRVAVLADGGEADTGSSSEISAYPIGSLKGDNAIVANADQEPLFTMNTNKENASYDSGSGKVSVEPVTKNNPDALASAPSETGATKDAGAEQNSDKQENQGAMMSGLKMEPNMSFQASTQLSANPFTCPSFERAISAAGFQKSGSHNDDGATNLR